MHACKIKRINFNELVLGKCKLKECIEWKENQQTVLAEQLAWSGSSTEENTDVTISILKNAFWSENQFSKGEIVWILCKKIYEESDRNAKVIFISKEDFLEDSAMLKKFLSLPEDAQKVAYAFLKGEKNEEKDEKQISNFIDPMNREDYYSIITSYLLPEQNEAYNRWRFMAHGPRGENNRRKLNYLLSISPGSPFHDHQKITYESIMKVFDDNIVGYKEVKENIARTLAEKQHLHKKRGIRILFHGLSGTGKTLWGKTIAKALDLNHKVINLASISSTVSIVGCESSYENSEPGMILKYFSECKTSETVITLDDFDKLLKPGTDRGKDGNVLESMLSLLDQEKAALRDAYIDNVPIDCSNTVCIITANRLDNIPSEVVNRCELVFEMSPYDKKTLMEIIEKQMPSVVKEYQLPEKWITQYVDQGLMWEHPFKGVGTQYILFSIHEPKLFQLLFMAEQPSTPDLSGVLPLIEESYEEILLSIQNDYGINEPLAEKLYRHLWIYTHGIATLCATKMCRFTGEEISNMIPEVCMSILKNMKG